MSHRKFALAAVCVIAAATASPASAALFSDNFNDDSGALVGETAVTGQTWVATNEPAFGGLIGGLTTGVAFGQGGSVGAGITGTVALKGNTAVLGQTISTGTWLLSGDIHKDSTVTSGNGSLFLTDGVAAFAASTARVAWSGTNILLEGVPSGTSTASLAIPIGFSTGNLHVDLTLDLDNDGGSLSWFDIDTPATNGTTNLVDLNPGPYGFKNIVPVVSALGTGLDNISLTEVLTPTHDWNATGSGSWNTASNWLPASVPDSNLSVAGFGDKITSAATVTANAAVTVNGIIFDNANKYTIAANTGADIITLVTKGSDLPFIAVQQGSHEFTAPVALNAAASVSVSANSSLNFNNVLDLNGSTLTTDGAGTVSITGTVTTGGGSVVVSGGVLNGTGTVNGDLTNSGGTVAPGLSAGTLTVGMGGDYLQTAGSLLIDINGTTAGIEHDVLDVAGNLTISGGSLDVVLGSFVPSQGDSFDILNFATADLNTSNFSLNLPALAPGLTWITSALGTTGTLSLATLGDFDGNGTVGLEDYLIMKTNWLSKLNALNVNGELTGPGGISDGTIDVYDFVEFRNLFPGGASGFASALAQASAVPEPSAIILLLAATPACLLRFRSRKKEAYGSLE